MADAKEAGPQEKGHFGALVVVYVTVFIDLMGFGLILPFLPYYAQVLDASGLELGILFTAYSAAQILGSIWLGRWSDRFGRRPILLASLAGGALAMAASAVATQLWALVAARALAGLFGGSIGSAQAYVADVTVPEERAKYMGLVGAAIGLGFVLGPSIGVLLRWTLGFGFREVALASAGLAAANFCAAFWLLKEPKNRRANGGRASWVDLAKAFGRPDLGPVLGASFLLTFAFVGMETTLAFYGQEYFGFDEKRFGLVLAYVSIVTVVVQGGLIGRLSRRFGVAVVARCGALLMGLSLLGLALAGELWLALVAVGVLAIGQGLTSPSLPTLASLASGGEEQGAILGLRQAAGAAARAIGPLVAGAGFDFLPRLPYVLGGSLALAAAWALSRIGTVDTARAGDG